MTGRGAIGSWLAAAVLALMALAGVLPAEKAVAGWSGGPSLRNTHANHTATLLGDGRVLVVGGGPSLGAGTAAAEIYDPATNRLSSAGDMATPRASHTATLLVDGRVLVTGGQGPSGVLAGTELYDPVTNSWSSGGKMTTPRATQTATLLADGRVLVAGGYDVSVHKSAELYDPDTNSWSATGSMATPHMRHTATLLDNGNVLVAGGDGTAAAELYDPATGTWSTAGSMADGRRWFTATRLQNGTVLVAAGEGSIGSQSIGVIARSELYSPAANSWAAAASLTTPRRSQTATLLDDGEVLVVGGETHAASAPDGGADREPGNILARHRPARGRHSRSGHGVRARSRFMSL